MMSQWLGWGRDSVTGVPWNQTFLKAEGAFQINPSNPFPPCFIDDKTESQGNWNWTASEWPIGSQTTGPQPLL